MLPFEFGLDHVRPDRQEGGRPPIIKQEIVADIIMEADDKVPGHFAIKKQRLFKNIYYYKGDMFLIVKTWEQVKYTEQTKDDSITEQDSPSKQQEAQEDKKEDSDEPVFSKNDFFIKTIRCFDSFYKIKKEILVEQVSGIFDQFRLYDVSMCQYEDKLYYYKRHQNPDASSTLRLYKLILPTYEEQLVEGFDVKEPENVELNATFS